MRVQREDPWVDERLALESICRLPLLTGKRWTSLERSAQNFVAQLDDGSTWRIPRKKTIAGPGSYTVYLEASRHRARLFCFPQVISAQRKFHRAKRQFFLAMRRAYIFRDPPTLLNPFHNYGAIGGMRLLASDRR